MGRVRQSDVGSTPFHGRLGTPRHGSALPLQCEATARYLTRPHPFSYSKFPKDRRSACPLAQLPAQLAPPGNRLGGVAAMPEGVPVTLRSTPATTRRACGTGHSASLDLAWWRAGDTARQGRHYAKAKNIASPHWATHEASRRNSQSPTAPDLAIEPAPVAAQPPS